MKSQHERKKRSPGSLAVSKSYRQFVLDQFEDLGEVTPRDMFGGVGLYWRDVFFGIIARDALYLKVDDSTRGEYIRRGMKPFVPYPNRRGTMQYYEVPLSVIESPTELASWAKQAIQLGS
jgi:DNA transformation protein and related proteins